MEGKKRRKIKFKWIMILIIIIILSIFLGGHFLGNINIGKKSAPQNKEKVQEVNKNVKKDKETEVEFTIKEEDIIYKGNTISLDNLKEIVSSDNVKRVVIKEKGAIKKSYDDVMGVIKEIGLPFIQITD